MLIDKLLEIQRKIIYQNIAPADSFSGTSSTLISYLNPFFASTRIFEVLQQGASSHSYCMLIGNRYLFDPTLPGCLLDYKNRINFGQDLMTYYFQGKSLMQLEIYDWFGKKLYAKFSPELALQVDELKEEQTPIPFLRRFIPNYGTIQIFGLTVTVHKISNTERTRYVYNSFFDENLVSFVTNFFGLGDDFLAKAEGWEKIYKTFEEKLVN